MRTSLLQRNADFRRLWFARAVSLAGSTVSREAIPYAAILTLGATPIQMGLLGAAATAPALLLGLFVGVWVDRLRRRPLMVVADLVRAGLIGSIPAAYLFDRLTMGQLYGVTAVVGIFTVCFDVASATYVPTLLSPDDLLEGNTKLGVSESIAEISGPPTGGLLVQVIGGPLTMLVDAVSFLISAVTLRRLAGVESPPAGSGERAHFWADLTVGLRVIRADRVLFALAAASATRNFFGWFFGAIYALYAIQVIGLGTGLIGVTVAMGGVGALGGALVVRRLTERWGLGPTIVGATLLASIAGLLIWLAGTTSMLGAVAALMVAQFLGDGCESIAAISEITLRQVITGERVLGRVNAGMTVLGTGVGTLGLLVGGALAQWLGLLTTVAIASVGSLAGCWWLVPLIRGPGPQAVDGRL